LIRAVFLGKTLVQHNSVVVLNKNAYLLKQEKNCSGDRHPKSEILLLLISLLLPWSLSLSLQVRSGCDSAMKSLTGHFGPKTLRTHKCFRHL